jgi:hypothetical protein
MPFENKAGFCIAGNVVRRFVPQSRKCAFLTLDVNRSPKPAKIEMRTFSRDLIEEIEQLTAGQNVEVSGQIDVEPVKSKKGEEIKVDGYTKWVPSLTVKDLKVDGSSVRAAETRKAAEQSKSTWGDEPAEKPPAPSSGPGGAFDGDDGEPF